MNQSTRKLWRGLITVLAAVGLSVMAAACGTAHKAASDSPANCSTATTQTVSAAQAQVTTDQAKVTSDHGTPATAGDKAQLGKDQVRLANLQKATAACTKPVAAVTAAVNSDSIANQINSVFQGFKPGQLAIGSANTNWAAHTPSRGIASFSTQTLMTQADVAKFLNGSSAQSQAAQARVVKAIQAAGYGQSEINRALNGTGYFPIQMKVASQIMGTTYFVNGQVYDESTRQLRDVGANDVIWLFMTSNQKIIFDAAIRADCGNPHLVKVTPLTPTSPPAPPITCATNCTNLPPCTLDICGLPTYQPPQSNSLVPPGAVRPTPGASTPPAPNPSPPTPPGQPLPPEPSGNGYNTGSPSGSGTSGGTTCDSSGCTSGSQTGSGGQTNTQLSGDGNGTQGGTSGGSSSTGSGQVTVNCSTDPSNPAC